MNRPQIATWSVTIMAVLAMLCMPLPAHAGSDDQEQATEDIIHMEDGRTLRGQIVSETSEVVIFKYVDKIINVSTQLTLEKHKIFKIERDVPVAGAAPKDTEPDTKPRPKRRASSPSSSDADDEQTSTYRGLRRAESHVEDVPSFYIIPMTGQMGTDVNVEIYREMVDDIRAHDPDYIVIKMNCKDIGNEPLDLLDIKPEESGLLSMVNEYRELANFFRIDLRDIPQVMWIEDSHGISSVVALAWSDIYLTPKARLAGLQKLEQVYSSWGDIDIKGKMREAWIAMFKSFLEYGGYSLILVDAMVRPEFQLSASWKGREVDWTLDTSGDYVLDSDDNVTAEFTAKSAENFCLSQGTAETLDDLVLLLGIREYRVLDGMGEEIYNEHSEDWRRTYDSAVQLLDDYQKYIGWASGDDDVKYYGKAKQTLERVAAAMRRYKAVEVRLGMRGVTLFGLETQIEVMKERLRTMRQGGRGGGGRGGRPPGRSRPGGGG